MIKHVKYGAEPKGLRFMNLEREENPSQVWLGKMSIIAREITACLFGLYRILQFFRRPSLFNECFLLWDVYHK